MPRRKQLIGDPKRAVALLRVSTDEQHLGPEAQRAAIETWAAHEEITVIEWFVEQGVSGATPIMARRVLQDAIAALPRHNAGVLAFAKRDRMARDVAMAQAIEALAVSVGAVVRTADGTSDGKGSAGLLSRGFHDLFGTYERAVIRERTTAALRVKKLRGERVGSIPYGFTLAPKSVQLVPVEQEQAIIREVLSLRREGLSTHKIARVLNDRSIFSRNGKPWVGNQIYRIVIRAEQP